MTKNDYKNQWLRLMGEPAYEGYERQVEQVRTFEVDEFRGQIYRQANGPTTNQTVLMMLPLDLHDKTPAVVVPFYYPDKVAGYDLGTLEPLEQQANAIGLFLVQRGYIVITAEAYHLTEVEQDRGPNDFGRWQVAGEALLQANPNWTGVGKLHADTQLLIDMLEADPRVDSDRIGIVGHSLGGKMAMYTGFLDERVRGVVASDFGLAWEDSNWSQIWYWGERLEALQKAGIDHQTLLKAGGLKPFGILAGEFDDASAEAILLEAGYQEGQYYFVNHATGHRPPREVLEVAFDWMETWL